MPRQSRGREGPDLPNKPYPVATTSPETKATDGKTSPTPVTQVTP